MNIGDLIRLLIALFISLMGVSQTPPPPPGAPPSSGASRVPLVIENVEVQVMESYPMQIALHVTGYQQDGCQTPIQVEQRRDGNTVHVRIYRQMDPAAICPAVIVPYDATIQLEGGFENGTYTFLVNDYRAQVTLGADASAPPSGPPGDTIMRRPVVIDSVEVLVLESYPMQLQLNISGHQNDACNVPVQVEQRREGNTVYVEIYRLHNPAMMCPFALLQYHDTITLEGGFESGSYTIHVNDYVVNVTL